MSWLNIILNHVRRSADPAVDRSLAAALPTADAASLGKLVELLLERHRPEGLLGLVLNFHRLPPTLQDRVVDLAPTLYRPIREAAGLERSHGPANAVRIIERARSAELAYLLAEILKHADKPVAAAAARCFLLLARQAEPGAATGSRMWHDARPISLLNATLRDALISYPRHQQPPILEAALCLLPTCLGDLIELFNGSGVVAAAGGAGASGGTGSRQRGHARPAARQAGDRARQQQHQGAAVVQALGRLLAEAGQPAARRNLLPLCCIVGLSEPAMRGLDVVADRDDPHWLEVLDAAHFLVLRDVRQALGHLREPARLWPGEEGLSRLPMRQLRALPLWAHTLPTEQHLRIARLRQLAQSHDATTRLLALRRLLQLAREMADATCDDAIASFCTDHDVVIARMALWHLVRCRYSNLPRILGQLVNSPHDSIRRIASRHLAPLGFARLWEQWPRLPLKHRVSAGRALIKIDAMFHAKLADRLLMDDRRARLRALGMIADLCQGSFFEEALVRLCQQDDAFIVSAAVRALGSASGQTVIATLERLLDHEDSRVRANAVEALEQLQSHRHVDALLSMARHDDNRPRANAIAALMEMRTSDAMQSLARMLGDPRKEHRTSALWLVDAMGLIEVARSVAEMSISDSDPAIRQRAAGAIQNLMSLMAGQGVAEQAEAELPV